MKKSNLIISIICCVCFVISMVAFTLVTVWPNNSNSNAGNVSNVSDETDVNEYSNEGATKGADFDPYYITDAESFIELVSKYGGSLKEKYVAKKQNSIQKLVVSQSDSSSLENDFYDYTRNKLDKDEEFVLQTKDGKSVYVYVLKKCIIDEDNLPEKLYDKDGKEIEKSTENYYMDSELDCFYAYEYVYAEAKLSKTSFEIPQKLYHNDKETEVDSLEELYLLSDNGIVYEVVKDDKGNVVQEVVKDDKGKVVYEKVSNEKTEKPHFEIVANLDFSNIDFKPLFESKKAFVGVINGKDYKLSNIEISVNESNCEDYFYTDGGSVVAHIGLFANANACELLDMNIVDMQITVDDNVYAQFANTKEITIGSLIAYDNGSKISNVKVESTLNAQPYGLVAGEKMTGANASSGLIGLAQKTEIKDVVVDVKLNADKKAQTYYYFGGLMGYGWETKVDGAKIAVEINAVSVVNKSAYYAGVVGQMKSSSISNVEVDLKVAQLETERFDTERITDIDFTKFNVVAGISVYLNDAKQDVKSQISNVKVNADVDMDAVFAGAFYQIANNEAAKVQVGKFDINADVNVLKVYGFVAVANNVEFNYDMTEENDYFNTISLKGGVTNTNGYPVCSFADGTSICECEDGIENTKLTITKTLYNYVCGLDKIRIDFNYYLEVSKN